MTYINAFRCHEGLVMSADTEEDWGDYKNYIEKLAIIDDQSYPLAIGGAGIGDLVEPMVQEVIENAKQKKPSTAQELRSLLKDAIDTVYKVDLPWLAVKKHERTPEFLIGAKPASDDFCIFRIKGRRLYAVKKMAIIGFGTPINNALLARMYRDNLPMQQAVMLAIYLVSLSKKLDEGVGGETSVVIVRDNGAWVDDHQYVAQAEAYIAEFLKLIDSLFLNSVDVSIPPSKFPERLQEFVTNAVNHRQNFANYSSQRCFERLSESGFKGDPYNKVFPGAIQEFTTAGFAPVREETQEERDRIRQRFEDARKAVNTAEASQKIAALTKDKQFIGIFDVPIKTTGS